MINRNIENTSNEEGKYGEKISSLIFNHYEELGGTNPAFKNVKNVDMSSDAKYQKQDIDHLYVDKESEEVKFSVEVKHDTWALGEGKGRPTYNIPFEVSTHLPQSAIERIRAKLGEKVTSLDKLYGAINETKQILGLKGNFIGCNRKCTANYVQYILSKEEKKENRRYQFVDALTVLNSKFEAFLCEVEIHPFKTEGKFWIKFTPHKEDNYEYNLSIIVPINELIEHKVAVFLPEEFKNNFREKYPQIMNEYHTSNEVL